MSLTRRARQRDQDGAAAVEFALVVPLLLLLVGGIVDYGNYYNDSLNVRQGVRDGARQGAVSNFGTGTGCGSVSTGGMTTDMANLACLTISSMGLGTTSPAAVRIKFVQLGSTAGFVQGNNLQICGMTKASSLTGMVPFPKGGIITTVVTTRIETPVVTNSEGTGGDATRSFSGATFGSWCP